MGVGLGGGGPDLERAIARERARDIASALEAEGRLKGESLRGAVPPSVIIWFLSVWGLVLGSFLYFRQISSWTLAFSQESTYKRLTARSRVPFFRLVTQMI